MWTRKNNGMYLDVSKVNTDEFKITKEDGLTFVGPKKNKWTWLKEERWLRSVVVDSNNRVVSCGWPKFGNYGEFLDETAVLNKALKENKPVRFSNKEDGSLCIRSVINDNITLRTRGTISGQFCQDDKEKSFYQMFYDVAEEKYPALLDPKYYPDYSLLFEYVSSENRIVLLYPETDLIFIGGVKHKDLSLISWNEVVKITQDMGLNIVELHELTNDPKVLVETIYKQWTGVEGIVARCNNDQTMVKIKSEDYLAKHRTIANMNYEAACVIIKNEKITTKEEMLQYCQDQDFDWELGPDMVSYLEEYKKAELVGKEVVQRSKDLIEEFETTTDFPEGRVKRKKFAAFIKSEPRSIRTVAFSLFGGKEGKINEFIEKLILNKGVGYEI